MSDRPEHWVKLTTYQHALSMRIATAFTPRDTFGRDAKEQMAGFVEIGPWAEERRKKKARDGGKVAASEAQEQR